MQDLPASCPLVPVPAERRGAALTWFLPPPPCSPEQSRLAELEEQAKSAKKGMWSEGTGSHTIRDLKYTIENPRHFVDSMHQKPVNGELAAVGTRGRAGGWGCVSLPALGFCGWPVSGFWDQPVPKPARVALNAAVMLFLALYEHGHAAARGHGEGGGQPWLCSSCSAPPWPAPTSALVLQPS